MAYSALRTVRGPNWDDSRGIREQDAWDEHAAFMDGLVADGFIVLGGPVGEGPHTLHVVSAGDAGQVTQRMRADPWAAMDLLRIESLEPWSLWLDGR